MITSKLALADDIDIKITKLLIYPIKSCRGIPLSESKFTPEGLLYDRQYVIVDASSHKFITARQIPQMVLIETAIEGDKLLVSFPKGSGIQSFQTALTPNSSTVKRWELISDVEIWRDKDLDAYVAQSTDAENSPSALLSSYLGREVLLVLKGPKGRLARPTPTHSNLDVSFRFQDGYPLLLATTESLAAVQEGVRLSASEVEGWKVGEVSPKWRTEELVMERFRPNIVLSGSPAPFDEDYWEDIQIGGSGAGGMVSVVGRCGRCLLPNVDVTTGLRDAAVPFKVITKFRKVEPKVSPCFGVNAVAQGSGTFQVGDQVRVLTVVRRETAETNVSFNK